MRTTDLLTQDRVSRITNHWTGNLFHEWCVNAHLIPTCIQSSSIQPPHGHRNVQCRNPLLSVLQTFPVKRQGHAWATNTNFHFDMRQFKINRKVGAIEMGIHFLGNQWRRPILPGHRGIHQWGIYSLAAFRPGENSGPARAT